MGFFDEASTPETRIGNISFSFNPKKNRNIRILMWIFIPIIVAFSFIKIPSLIEGHKMNIAVIEIKKFLPGLHCQNVIPKGCNMMGCYDTYVDCVNADNLTNNEATFNLSSKSESQGWNYTSSSKPDNNMYGDKKGQELSYVIQKTINGMDIKGEWLGVTGSGAFPGVLRISIK